MGIDYENLDISNNFLRGGPALKRPGGASIWFDLGTDSRKPIRFAVNPYFAWGFGKTVFANGYWFDVTVQPTNAINISLSPFYEKRTRLVQYVTNLEYQGEPRYINSSVEQKTLSLSARVNYTILPNLTIQYYAQPFISRGQYKDFKHIVQPIWDDFHDSYVLLDTEYDEAEGIYRVDENGDSVVDYEFRNPDFNFIQFRSNLVARWEYIPGSEIFLVWTQGATNFEDPQIGLLPSLGNNLFSGNFRNIFLLKLTYRFVR